MNIVIVGAGAVGLYVSMTLSAKGHNVILVDKNPKKLEQASWQMDIATRLGSGTDWELLDELLELDPDVFIAVTDHDETNLVASSIAKNLGYPKTIARLHQARYFNRTRLDFGRIFDVDYIIGPEILVAYDILKSILQPGALAVEHFAHGKVQLRTIQISQKWRQSDKTLAQLSLPEGIMIGLIRRDQKVIFPHGNDHIRPGDEVTLIGQTEAIANIPQFFKVSQKHVDSVVLIGGTLVAVNIANLLRRRNIAVRIIEADHARCCELAELLPDCIVINHSASDLEFLESEKIGGADFVVVCTDNDDTNILTALLAQQAGCRNNIVLLSSTSYLSVVAKLGITSVASPRVSATNKILSACYQVR